MKKLFILLSIPVIFAIGCDQQSDGKTPDSKPENSVKSYGHEQGNGVDSVPFDQQDAWFSGPRTVTYCAEISPDFGVSAAEANQNLLKAFETWKDYIAKKKINEKIYEEILSGLKPGEEHFAMELQLFTDTSFQSQCDGSEDIKFFFGTEDTEVTKAKVAHINPVAFAFNQSRNPLTGQGKGFVWVAKAGSLAGVTWPNNFPDWSLPNRLLGILMHEIGHIYGNGHMDGTIMRENLDGFLREGFHSNLAYENAYQKSLEQIDFDQELFSVDLKKLTEAYNGVPSLLVLDRCRYEKVGVCSPAYDTAAVDAEMKENFREIVGTDPAGSVTSSYLDGKIQLMDSNSSHVFALQIDFDHPSITGHPTFQISRDLTNHITGEGTLATRVQLKEHSTYLGTLKKTDGNEVTILIERNFIGPFSIFFFSQGQKKPLLVMDQLAW